MSKITAVQSLALGLEAAFQNLSGLQNNWTKSRNQYVGRETEETGPNSREEQGCEDERKFAGWCTDWLLVFLKTYAALEAFKDGGEVEATKKSKAEEQKGREWARRSISSGERESE